MPMLELHRDAQRLQDEPIKHIDSLIVAGWTGRDAAAVEHHVRELAALGVAPPSSIPLYYRVAASLLTTAGVIDVVDADTSGEVEPLLVRYNGETWLGLASDHTDRALEAHSVALSKQACAKPCASGLWPFSDVADRLDTLTLRSWILEGEQDDADWTLYQEGSLETIRPLADLLAASPLGESSRGESTPGDSTPGESTRSEATRRRVDAAASQHASPAVSAMLCGTLPAIGGVRPAHAFRCELHDPASGQTLQHEYAVRILPLID